MKAPSADKHPDAQENWRRVKALWFWTGRTDDDVQIAKRLGAYALTETLQRARLGHEHAAGRFQRGKVERIVGAVLGVDYLSGLPRSVLHEYRGPGDKAFVAHLRSLPEQELFDVAEGWVNYLTRTVDHAPPAWKPPAPPPTYPDKGEDASVPAMLSDLPTAPEQLPSRADEGSQPRSTRRTLAAWTALALVVVAVGVTVATEGGSPARQGRATAESGSVKGERLGKASLAQLASTVDAPKRIEQALDRDPGEGSPTTAVTAAVTPPARVSIVGERAHVRLAVQNGSQLRTGDHLWFQLEVEEPLFVYLVSLAEGGISKVMYPLDRELLVAPGKRQRVPSGQDTFELDDQVGVERILLLTTSAALARDHRELPLLLSGLAQEGRWPTDWPALVAPDTPVASVARHSDNRPGERATETRVQTRGLVLAPAEDPKRRTAAPVLVTAEFISLYHLR